MSLPENIQNLSRRRFMTVAGGVAGAAALSAIGLSAENGECSSNIAEIDAENIGLQTTETDVLVIGGGIAGLFAAVKAHDAGARVMMVVKGRLGASGQTPFARGIFAYDPSKEKMSIEEFVDSVSRSAIGTNNPVFTEQMARHSEARVIELRQWGFFDSALYNKSFSKPINDRNIPVSERIMLTHLVTDKGKTAGAAGFNLDDGTVHVITAKSVILCTGAGGFKPNGFPICDLTHDGTAMAYRIGARVTGKEWNDGHGANSKNPAAVYDQWGGMLEGSPSVTGVGIRHDLGVDLNYGVYKQGPETEGADRPMFRGEQVEGGPYRPSGFDKPGGGPPPGQDHHEGPPPHGEGKRGRGKPPGGMRGAPSGGASAGMAIHKAEGLVPINSKCETDIPGLYAAGDALGSHMAGGIYTQIGSSMAGSAVQGAIAGEYAAMSVKDMVMPVIAKARKEELKSDILKPLTMKRGYSPSWVTQTLQSVMIPNFILYIKKENLMHAALAYIEELRDHHQPMLKAGDIHELRLAHETMNMILNAEMKLKASIMRKESRCSHYRLDYPEVNREEWDCWINISMDKEGKMKLEKQAFDKWPL